MRTIKEIEMKARYFTENRTKCPNCGHTLLITNKDGKELCTHCHKYVFANKEIELRYRNAEKFAQLRRELNEQRRNANG